MHFLVISLQGIPNEEAYMSDEGREKLFLFLTQ